MPSVADTMKSKVRAYNSGFDMQKFGEESSEIGERIYSHQHPTRTVGAGRCIQCKRRKKLCLRTQTPYTYRLWPHLQALPAISPSPSFRSAQFEKGEMRVCITYVCASHNAWGIVWRASAHESLHCTYLHVRLLSIPGYGGQYAGWWLSTSQRVPERVHCALTRCADTGGLGRGIRTACAADYRWVNW